MSMRQNHHVYIDQIWDYSAYQTNEWIVLFHQAMVRTMIVRHQRRESYEDKDIPRNWQFCPLATK